MIQRVPPPASCCLTRPRGLPIRHRSRSWKNPGVSASPGPKRRTTLFTPPKQATARKRNVWYIGYNKDMAQEFINDCANWARAYNLAASAMEEIEYADVEEFDGVIKEKKILAFRITFQSGWRITALSSRPSNLRGKQGRVVIDEAAFHEDLASLIKAAMAFLIWGGQVRIISTHNGDSNEFNSLVQDIRAGRKPYSLHRLTLIRRLPTVSINESAKF